jgi:uncharacterized protein with ParB-like and HNH nuclease domain
LAVLSFTFVKNEDVQNLAEKNQLAGAKKTSNMEASTTIKKMLSGNKIIVPSYQRAYSWDTEILKEEKPQQVNVFLSDLEEYNNSRTKAPYYFGHFLFEEFGNNKYGVIDGQQRLTTIVIFLSALFKLYGKNVSNE